MPKQNRPGPAVGTMFGLGALCVALSACEGGGPASATPSASATPPPVNSFALTSFSPEAGSTLKMGDSTSVSGYYTTERDGLSAGFAVIRENGVGLISTITNWSSEKPPWRINGGLGFDPRNAAYDFCRGHIVDMLFVIGDPKMMGAGDPHILWNGNLKMEYVVFQYRIPTHYKVEGKPVE